uniref:Uncharacterized protein n=1 Tax=Trichogramma kaykai TaxID=54128 RepID=A0ABD2XKB5_9HYME
MKKKKKNTEYFCSRTESINCEATWTANRVDVFPKARNSSMCGSSSLGGKIISLVHLRREQQWLLFKLLHRIGGEIYDFSPTESCYIPPAVLENRMQGGGITTLQARASRAAISSGALRKRRGENQASSLLRHLFVDHKRRR